MTEQTFRRNLSLRFTLILLSMLACASPLLAQTFRGTILGTVTYFHNGEPIPDTKVTAKNVATGLERSAVTDADGNYTIAELPIGTYEVFVPSPTGENSVLVKDVVVEVASEKRVDVRLDVSGGLTSTVEVRANTAQVETTSNTLGGTITTRQVQDLPAKLPSKPKHSR